MTRNKGAVIVFGSEGFVGTYLVDELVSEGFNVLAAGLDDLGEAYYRERKIPFAHVDITKEEDFSELATAGVGSVVNMACLQPVNVKEAEYSASDYVKVNVLGTLNVLEFCRRNGIRRIICAVSYRAVQSLYGTKVITESDTKAIKYGGEYAMYSISETAAVDCVKHYSEQHGMQGIVFRLPPVFGYGPHTEGFKEGKPHQTGFKVFVESAERGQAVELWGDCEKARDVIYVKDVVSAIILALDSKKAVGLYNLGSGKLLSLREEAEEIIRAFSPIGRPSKIVYRPDKANSIDAFVCDISRAKRDLGWYPKYSFPEMLEDYKKEMKSARFSFLVEKRRRMMNCS